MVLEELKKSVEIAEQFDDIASHVESALKGKGYPHDQVMDSLSMIEQQVRQVRSELEGIPIVKALNHGCFSDVSPSCVYYDDDISKFVTLETEIEELQKHLCFSLGEKNPAHLQDFFKKTERVLQKFEDLEQESQKLYKDTKSEHSLPRLPSKPSTFHPDQFGLDDLGISDETKQLIEESSQKPVEAPKKKPMAPIIIESELGKLPEYVGKYIQLDEVNKYLKALFDASCCDHGTYLLSRERAQDVCRKNPMYLMGLELLRKIKKSKDRKDFIMQM